MTRRASSLAPLAASRSPRRAARPGDHGVRRRRSRPSRRRRVDHAGHLRLVPRADTSLNDALAAFTDETGIDVDLVDRRRRRDDGVQGRPDRRQPRGRRDVRRRQHVPVAGRRRRRLRAVRGRRPRRRARRAPGARPRATRRPRSTTATSASTTTSAGSPSTASIRPPTSPTLADAATATSSSSRTRRRRRPGWRSCSPRSPSSATTAGPTTGPSSRDNGVEVVDGWNEAYYERVHAGAGGDRPLVVSYGSSPPAEVIFADPPIDEPPTGGRRVDVLPPGRVRRRPRRHRRPRRGPAARRLPRLRARSRPSSRSTCSCTRPTATSSCPRSSPTSRSSPTTRYDARPGRRSTSRARGWIETWTDTVLR